jgi:hypothetical protein
MKRGFNNIFRMWKSWRKFKNIYVLFCNK